MSLEKTPLVLLIIGMTFLSSLGDVQGFVHAAKVWQGGKLVWSEVGQSALGFAFGIFVY